jgi:hypothetical protein
MLGTSLVAQAQSADEQVKAAYAAWDEAFNKKDAKALAALYTDDAIFLPATHDILEGPASIEKFFTAIFGMGATDHKSELINAEDGLRRGKMVGKGQGRLFLGLRGGWRFRDHLYRADR